MTTTGGKMEWPDIEQYSDIPMFNTKSVVQQTGVPAPTLRAWERRYALISPERANNAYRLYSERDIALIRWLKERVDSGMSISQAIAFYRHLAELRQQYEQRGENLPTYGSVAHYDIPVENAPTFQVALNPPDLHNSHLSEAQDNINADVYGADRKQFQMSSDVPWGSYPTPHNMRTVKEHLIEVFQNLDEQTAQIMMGSMLSLYSVEQICSELITPTLWDIGKLWAEGALTVSVEHFASNFFRALLINMFHVTPPMSHGPLVLTSCAPGEPHEIAVLMLSLLLRRSGVRVAYLGQSIETAGLIHTIKKLSPAMVCVSLTISSYMPSLANLGRQIQHLPEPRPIFTFGGQAFRQFTESASLISGIYLEGDLRIIGGKIRELLAEHQSAHV